MQNGSMPKKCLLIVAELCTIIITVKSSLLMESEHRYSYGDMENSYIRNIYMRQEFMRHKFKYAEAR